MADAYRLDPRQFAAVSVLPAPDRYAHCIARMADWEWVWGLRKEGGWASAEDDAGHRILPIWPHPDYAAACASGPWAGNAAEPIALHEFLGRWLPGMDRDRTMAAVFPTPSMRGTIVSALQLQQALRDAWSQIGS